MADPKISGVGAFGDLRLVDSETGGMQEVTFGRYRMKAYQLTVQNFLQRLREYGGGECHGGEPR